MSDETEWVLVPREASSEMLTAAIDAHLGFEGEDEVDAVWTAMISAAEQFGATAGHAAQDVGDGAEGGSRAPTRPTHFSGMFPRQDDPASSSLSHQAVDVGQFRPAVATHQLACRKRVRDCREGLLPADNLPIYLKELAEANRLLDVVDRAARAERDLFRDETIELVRQNGEWQARAEQLAEAQPVDRARTLDAARFRAACYALKEKVEGVGCERWAAPDGSRLKDTPEWVAFYNHVSNMHERGGPPPSAPVGMDAAAVEAGHITFESMKQCADSWLAVVDTLNTVAPGWSEKEGTGRECATATIAALAQQTAAHPAITHCDNCGCDWLDNGLNPAACPYCKPPAAVDEATRRDAERYRWLRAIPESVRADHERNPANGGWDAPFYWPGSAAGEELQGRDLDAAIDAAVQQEACHA